MPNTIQSRSVQLWKQFINPEYFILSVSILYFLFFLILSPNIISPYNLSNLFSNMLPLLIVATGQTVVLITAGIDLSVTSTVSLASVAGAMIFSADQGWLAGEPYAIPAGILAMLAVGLLIGSLNGFAITQFGMPPFIVTLTTMIFVQGFAIWITQSQNIFNLPDAFNAIYRYRTAGYPVFFFVITIGILLLVHLLLRKTLPGRWIYAVGHNDQAARISGVPVRLTLFMAYVISGVCAATAAILYTARLGTGSPTIGDEILLDVIGATVIGGTSLFGGKGKVLWTVYGVLFISLINNTLNMYGLSFSIIIMVKGTVILLAALLDSFRNRILTEA